MFQPDWVVPKLARTSYSSIIYNVAYFTNHIGSLNSLFCRFSAADVLNLVGNMSMS